MTKEKINLEIKGTPLIKFQSAERIESLQHGHIYAKTLAYYDASEDYANVFISLLKGIWNIAFWKRKSYAYQQEARFVFIPDGSDDDHVEMDIEDISDISYVVPAEMALTALVEKKS